MSFARVCIWATSSADKIFFLSPRITSRGERDGFDEHRVPNPYRQNRSARRAIFGLSFNAMKLIFLHYFGGGPRSCDGVAARLNGVSIDTPDLREVGRLPAGYSVERAATDTMQIVGEPDEPFVLVGHSMGGKIAVAIAARQPRNLRGCVLIAPSPPSPEPMDDDARAWMLEGHGTRAGAEKIVKGAAGSELAPEVWETAIAANLAYGDRDWTNWIEIGTREDISSVTANIAVPVLVVAGGRDKDMSASFLRGALVEKIAGAQLAEIAGAGHLMPQEKPDEVARLIHGFTADLG